MVRTWIRGVCLVVFCWCACGVVDLSGQPIPNPAQAVEEIKEAGLSSVRWNSYGEYVEVFFTHGARMAAGNFSRHVEITPALKNSNMVPGWNRNSILIYGDWTAETTYAVKVKASIPLSGNRALQKDGMLRVRIPRLRPAIDMLAQGLFYPLHRKGVSLPVSLRNVSKITMSVHALDPRNLVPYSLSESRLERMTEPVVEKTFDVSGTDNKAEDYLLDLTGYLPHTQAGTMKPGLYMVQMNGKDSKDDEQYAAWMDKKFLVLTDLGVAVCEDQEGRQILVSVRRLSDNQPVAGASVVVSSEKNLPIATVKTGEDGLCRIEYDSRFTADNLPRIVVVRQDDDVSMIELRTHGYHSAVSSWNRVDFTESGSRIVTSGPQAFVFWERGAIRPGESGHVVALLRQREAESLPVLSEFPCVLALRDPSGNVISQTKVTSDRYGYVSHCFELVTGSSTGRYVAECRIDGGRVLGEAPVLVSAFVPDRLQVEVDVDRKAVVPGESFTGTVRGKYYYGEPAAECTGNMLVESAGVYRPSHWKGFAVGGLKDEKELENVRAAFPWLGKERTLTYQVPADYQASNPSELYFQGTVLEAGGRGVSRNKRVIVDPCGWYLGVKQVEDGQEKDIVVDYGILSVNPEDKPVLPQDTQVTAKIYRITWDLVQSKSNGRYRWEWTDYREPIGKEIVLAVNAGGGTFRLPNIPSGHYEIEFRSDKGRGTLLDCWHCYGEGGKRLPDPNALTCVTDKASYLPGQTAEISFEASDKGYAIMVCGESGMETTKAIPVSAGKNTLKVAIPAWLPTESYYCCLTVVTGAEPHTRLFGMVRLAVNQAGRKLQVKLEAPAVVRPEQEMTVKVALKDSDGKPAAGLAQIFLVDKGVLSLTDFTTPNPYAFFFGSKNCRLSFWDLYDELYPELTLKGLKRIGGDAAMGRIKGKFGEEEREKSAVVWVKPVEIGADGVAEFKVIPPKFLGAMRIMCVVTNDRKVGSGERDVIVRDQLGVTGSCPRAVVPGDEFDCVFTLNNFDLPEGDYAFQVALPPGVQALGPVCFKGRIGQGKPVSHALRVRALDRLGASTVSFSLAMGNVKVDGSMGFIVRGLNPPVSLSQTVMVLPGTTQQFNISHQDWLVGTGKGELAVSGLSVTGLSDGINWLNNYSYGCLEQTAACALPFLRADQLVHVGVLTAEEASTYRTKMRLAAERIKSLYLWGGRFSLWPGMKDAAEHASLFAANFLFALNRQHPQDSVLLKNIKRLFLNNLVENASQPEDIRGYACYILSLLDGDGTRGDSAGTVAAMNMLASGRESWGTMLASAALIKAGHAAEGMPFFRKCLEQEVWRSDDISYVYGDDAARLGMTLNLVMEIMPGDSLADRLAYELTRRVRTDGQGWGTTQGNAWATLALAAYAANHRGGSFAGYVQRENGKKEPISSRGIKCWKLRQGEPVRVVNTGKESLFVSFRQEGVPRGPMARVSGALSIRRTYYNEQGQQVFSAKQGDLLTVVLELDSLCNISDLVVVDLLPGGLEIEDSQLATRAVAFNGRGQAKHGRLCPRFVERRDDRMILFGDFLSNGKGRFSYQVRAVSRGRYGIPPVTVEAMYAPDLRAVGVETGAFEVR